MRCDNSGSGASAKWFIPLAAVCLVVEDASADALSTLNVTCPFDGHRKQIGNVKAKSIHRIAPVLLVPIDTKFVNAITLLRPTMLYPINAFYSTHLCIVDPPSACPLPEHHPRPAPR